MSLESFRRERSLALADETAWLTAELVLFLKFLVCAGSRRVCTRVVLVHAKELNFKALGNIN